MTSGAAAKSPLPWVRGLVFLGFPLHAPGNPGVERAAHLERVQIPMLFLQGTRDTLADLGLVKSVTDRLPGATLHVVEGGDHSFAVLKRSGRTETEVMTELLDTTVDWMTREGIA
jgi:predicted alpha/beta-hydrolase family hydrolase